MRIRGGLVAECEVARKRSKTEDLPAVHRRLLLAAQRIRLFLAELPGVSMQVQSRESVSIREDLFCHRMSFFLCCCSVSANADDRSPIAGRAQSADARC